MGPLIRWDDYLHKSSKSCFQFSFQIETVRAAGNGFKWFLPFY